MKIINRWYRRIAALLGGAALGALVPAVAWAHTNPVAVAVGEDLARRRVGRGGGLIGGLLGAICCLFVVAVIVIIVLMVARKRRR